MEAALQRGDWRVVELLSFPTVDWAGLFVLLDRWKDPGRENKARRLMRLGATQELAQYRDNLYTKLDYPEAMTAEGDAWAQQMYAKYFSSQAKLTKEPKICTADAGNR